LTLDVELHRRRARKLLAMVEKRFEVELPEVIAHTAYYAMYHAALAALIHAGIPVPKTLREWSPIHAAVQRGDTGWGSTVGTTEPRPAAAADCRL
jgi:hypothetical protein